MRILPVDGRFQPAEQCFMSPPHNAQWNVSTDFDAWAHEHQDKLPGWDYLPLYWNRLYINWNWGQDGLDDIQSEIDRLVSHNRPTFTICEYDLQAMQPFFDLHGMVVCTASRQEDGVPGQTVDIPLLCSEHAGFPEPNPARNWLASFAGNLWTHSPRPEMWEALKHRADVHMEHVAAADAGEDHFVEMVRDSYVALCPRAHGGQTMRFYEAMQLGTVPLHIGTPDTRPFKRWIDWDAVSFYVADAKDLAAFVDNLPPRAVLAEMGKRARALWYNELQYGQWCKYVVRELEAR